MYHTVGKVPFSCCSMQVACMCQLMQILSQARHQLPNWNCSTRTTPFIYIAPHEQSFLPNPIQSVNHAVAMVYQRCAAVTVILSSWSHQPCPCVVGPSSTTTLISNLSAAGNIAQIRDLPAAYQTSSINRLSRLQQANLRSL